MGLALPGAFAMSVSTLREARRLARLGFRIVRLKPKSKQPADIGWLNLATISPATIRSWPIASNVGVAGGSPLVDGGRLLIVDVDVKHGLRICGSFPNWPPTSHAAD